MDSKSLASATVTAKVRRAGRIAVALIALTSVVGVAGCSSQSGAATASDGKTVLKVYGWKGGDAEPANMEKVNTAFEQAHPDIDVQFEYVPGNDAYTQKVQPELLAGNSADVIMTDSSKVQDWGSAGYLEDLGGNDWSDSVIPEVSPFIQEEGTTYALPMELIGIDLYANLDLLKKAGVNEVPATYPDFVAALQKLKDAGITPISLPNKGGWTGASVVNAIAATKVYQDDPDWDKKFLDGSASFSDWKSSADQMMELQSKGFVDFSTELGVDEWGQGLADFTSGKSAFWFQGAWNQSAVTKAGINSVFIPWPAGDKGQESSANLFVGTMWSINAKSKVKDAAKEYVDFWSDSTNAAPFVEAENAVTPFKDGKTPSTPATKDFVAAVDAGRYRILPSDSWFTAAGEKQMQQGTQALWLGQVDVNQYVSDLDKLRDKK
ncbi:ABC transporter substrate-binding protein [Arthrobacter sp. R4-81]